METKVEDRLVKRLRALATGVGLTPSALPEVKFFKATRRHPRAPVVYEPCIVIVVQGCKRGYLGERVFEYDARNYLVLSIPLPFECETEATPEKPLLALILSVDPTSLGELLVDMGEEAGTDEDAPQAIVSSPLTDELADAVDRLLACLESALDSRVLGPQIVREIVYRVLRGEQGAALRAVIRQRGQLGNVARAMRRIHTDFASPLDIETLAREARMGVSTFHRSFKAITATSPLKYLKSIRLYKAWLLLSQDGINAGEAARRVGYASVSQFSREFKRFFGSSPTEVARVRNADG